MSEPSLQPFLSVVVALYNEEDNLEMCTEALFRQSYPKNRYEIILVDDGSEDRSAEICRSIIAQRGDQLPVIRYVPIEHAGLSAGRNSGIAETRGDFIAFIDADAVARENWIEALVNAFEERQLDVIGGGIDPLNEESRLAHFFAAIHYDQLPVVGCNMAYRPEVFERVGGFCPIFTCRGDEANLLRRIRATGEFRIEQVSDARVKHFLPPTPKQWLRERWTTGRLWYHHRQVDRAYGMAASTREVAMQIVQRLVNLSFLPLLLVWGMSGSIAALVLAVPGILLTVARHVVPGRSTRVIFHTLCDRFGMAMASLLLLPAVVTQYLGTLADDLAFAGYAFVDQTLDPGPVPFPLSGGHRPEHPVGLTVD